MQTRHKFQTMLWELEFRLSFLFICFIACFVLSFKNATQAVYLILLSYPLFSSCFSENELVKETSQFSGSFNEEQEQAANQGYVLQDSDSNRLRFIEQTNPKHLFDQADLPDFSAETICLIFTDVQEAFSTIVFLAIILSFASVLPIALYNLVCFVLPCFYCHEKRNVLFYSLLIFLSWTFVLVTLQLYIIPELADFFLDFQIKTTVLEVKSSTRISAYISWNLSILGIASLLFVLCLFFLKHLFSNVLPTTQIVTSSACQSKNKQLVSKQAAKQLRVSSQEICSDLPSFSNLESENTRKTTLYFLIFVSCLISPPDLVIQVIIFILLYILKQIIVYQFFIARRINWLRISC